MRNEFDNDNTDVEATENIHSIESAVALYHISTYILTYG